MRLSNVVRLYRVRLRSRVVQERSRCSGIAVGVALLFASQVASTSLNGSVEQITDGIVGADALPACRARARRASTSDCSARSRLARHERGGAGARASASTSAGRSGARGGGPARRRSAAWRVWAARSCAASAMRGSPTCRRLRCPRRSLEAIGVGCAAAGRLQIGTRARGVSGRHVGPGDIGALVQTARRARPAALRPEPDWHGRARDSRLRASARRSDDRGEGRPDAAGRRDAQRASGRLRSDAVRPGRRPD